MDQLLSVCRTGSTYLYVTYIRKSSEPGLDHFLLGIGDLTPRPRKSADKGLMQVLGLKMAAATLS